MVQDYCYLNKWTIKNNYPLLLISIERTYSKVGVATVDLCKSGRWLALVLMFTPSEHDLCVIESL